MVTVKTQDTQTITLRNQEVGGILLNAVIFAAIAGTAISGTAVDTEKIRIKAILRRSGESPKVIYNDLLKYYLLLDSFFKGSFSTMFTGLPGADSTLVANAVGVVQKAVHTMFLSFGKTYKLVGSDRIDIEINCTGWNGDTVDSDSYLEVYPIDDEELDTTESEVIAYNIQANKGAEVINLGNGVTDIAFIVLDKTSILDASAVISSIAITSKQLNMTNVTQNALIGMRQLAFEDVAKATARHQCFMLHTGYPIDEAKLDLSLVAANVNASKVFVVYRKQAVTPSTINRGRLHQVQKNVAVLQKAGLPKMAQELVRKAA